MTTLSAKIARMNELEWLILNETNGEIRASNIREYHDLYEELHGPGSNHASREADLRPVRQDL